jgi:ABC-type uncharacterized transport system substrate-binding protein
MYSKSINVDPIVTLSSGKKIVACYEVEAEVDGHDVMLGDYDTDYVEAYDYETDEDVSLEDLSDEDTRLVERAVNAAVARSVERLGEGDDYDRD